MWIFHGCYYFRSTKYYEYTYFLLSCWSKNFEPVSLQSCIHFWIGSHAVKQSRKLFRLEPPHCNLPDNYPWYAYVGEKLMICLSEDLNCLFHTPVMTHKLLWFYEISIFFFLNMVWSDMMRRTFRSIWTELKSGRFLWMYDCLQISPKISFYPRPDVDNCI